MLKLMAVLAAILMCMNAVAAESGSEPEGKPRPGLVCTGCLAANLQLENLRIIDARTSMGAYIKSHIPGAVYLNIESLRLASEGIPGRILTPDRLAQVFSDTGIGNDTPVVVYSSTEDALANATYVALALAYAGHETFAVLDGGFEQWEKESLPLTAEIRPVAKANFRPKKSKVLASRAEVETVAKGKHAAVLVDARPAASFAGGHIPGARNLPSNAIGATPDAPLWLKPEDLDAAVRPADIAPSAPVVAYCSSGREASKIWFTLKYVQKWPNVTVYDGSMAEWVALGLPQETAKVETTTATATVH